MSSHRSKEDFRNILLYWRFTVCSLHYPEWKNFGTIRTLSRAGILVKLSNWWRRALVNWTAHHLHSIISSKVCRKQPHAMVVFFSGRDWGTHKSRILRIYWDGLIENLVQSIQNLRLGRRLTFQHYNEPQHTAGVAMDNSVNVLEWRIHSFGMNPIKFLWRNLKISVDPHPSWQSLRGEEVRGRIADNYQMQMCKACRIIPQIICCKGALTKYWVMGMNTYAMYWFQFFIFNRLAKLSQTSYLLCQYGVWSVDWCGEKAI